MEPAIPNRTGGPLRIAVLIPCLNEEATIDQVVRDFRASLPTATVSVCDNASRDATAARARKAGAVVAHEMSLQMLLGNGDTLPSVPACPPDD